MAKLYKAAIIGCGDIAGGYQSNNLKDKSVLTHAKAYSVHRHTEIIGAVDTDKQRLDGFCKKWGIPNKYISIQRMLEEVKPHIVSICTPSQTHQDILKLCTDSGNVKAIWCEKPIGTDYNFIKRLFRNKNKIFYTNHLRRWDIAAKKIKDLIHTKFLGKPLLFNCSCAKDFFENGSHIIDLIYYLMGPPKRIKIINVVKNNKGRKNEIFPDIHMEFENKTRVYILRNNIEFNCFEIDFLFTKGRIRYFNNGFNVKYYPVIQSRRFPGHHWISTRGKTIHSDLDRSMLRILDNIIKDLNRGRDIQNNLAFELESFYFFCDVYNKIKEFLQCRD